MMLVVVAVVPFMSNEIDYYFTLNLNQPFKRIFSLLYINCGSPWAEQVTSPEITPFAARLPASEVLHQHLLIDSLYMYVKYWAVGCSSMQRDLQCCQSGVGRPRALLISLPRYFTSCSTRQVVVVVPLMSNGSDCIQVIPFVWSKSGNFSIKWNFPSDLSLGWW